MNKEFLISKLSFRENEQLIDQVEVGLLENGSVIDFGEHNRDWLIKQHSQGNKLSGLKRTIDNKWARHGYFSFDGKYFSWTHILPKKTPKRNVFISYYHRDDQLKRQEFDNLFRDLIINQSVMMDEINGENSDDYIHRLINEGYMKDTTVLVVLLGPNTKCRKHVDWEISGALNRKVGERYAGLLGLRLPTHPEYGTGTDYQRDNYPVRLAENLNSGYAVLGDWSENRRAIQDLIELAFTNRNQKEKIKNAGVRRLAENLCE